MKQFLDQLFSSGAVTVPQVGVPFDFGESFDAEVLQFDRAMRLSLAGTAPTLEIVVARWAAGLLAEAARLTVARDVGAIEMEKILSQPCPRPRSAEVDYSADLFLRYLPELLAWIQRLAPGDPLVQHMRRLGGEWPLSSVGMRELTIAPIEPFIGHAALRQLYVDRILATGDASRLDHPRVSEAVRIALGAHPELAPAMAKAVGLVAEPTE